MTMMNNRLTFNRIYPNRDVPYAANATLTTINEIIMPQYWPAAREYNIHYPQWPAAEILPPPPPLKGGRITHHDVTRTRTIPYDLRPGVTRWPARGKENIPGGVNRRSTLRCRKNNMRRKHGHVRRDCSSGGGVEVIRISAPRNTTSYLIRAKKAGGIAALVSPLTPAVLETPVVPSPSPSDLLVDSAADEWGVNGYGTMNGLIRLKPITGTITMGDGNGDGEEEAVEGEVCSQRSVEVDVERFEMAGTVAGVLTLEHRVDDQDMMIEQLAEENSSLRERVSVIEGAVEVISRRLQALEDERAVAGDVIDGELGVVAGR